MLVGFTLLILAAQEATGLATLRVLLQAKADPNRSNSDGIVPAIAAAKVGSTDAMRELVQFKADIHRMDNNGVSAVMVRW